AIRVENDGPRFEPCRVNERERLANCVADMGALGEGRRVRERSADPVFGAREREHELVGGVEREHRDAWVHVSARREGARGGDRTPDRSSVHAVARIDYEDGTEG